MSKDKLTFAMPEGMPTPEGKKVGDTFEAPAMFELEEGGKVCLVSVNGMKLAGYEEEKEDAPDNDEDGGEKDEFMDNLRQEYTKQKSGMTA